ncbi:hypothetical protein M3Y97_00239000 [Aphelenchoides bicaudatus]|nr:hypothetical protein M3Y97_00239000 [Aphelenchoides bicaudatus]
MTTEAELSKDLAELQKFRTEAERPRTQKALDVEIKTVTQELEKARAEKKKAAEAKASASTTGGSSQILPTKSLTTYAFDESEKFVKLYYTLAGVQSLPKESIGSSFTDNSFSVNVKNLSGINYIIEARDLNDYIDSEKSLVKQKSDLLLVMLKKLKEGVQWGKLLALDKKEEVKMPDIADNADPQASMMEMMKSLYDSGDDEMKRQIKKSFYESNQKKGMGGDVGNFNM